MKRPADIEASRKEYKGKHILRLPENIVDKIDNVIINGVPFRNLLKFKPQSSIPRGYPDVYFDGQTWDFKAPSSSKEDTIRQHIKDGRKADNLIFIIDKPLDSHAITKALKSEYGMRKRDGSWNELPNVYCMNNNELTVIWIKEKRRQNRP